MDTLKIGMPATITGNYALQGIESHKGIKLWLDKVVKQSGIKLKNNKRVIPELIFYDNKSNPDTTKKIAEKLIVEDNADILLGPYSSTLTLEFTKICAKHNRVVWNFGGSSDDIHRYGYKKIVSAITEASNYFHGIINLIDSIYSSKEKVAILKAKGSGFAENVSNGAIKQAQIKGIDLIVFEYSSPNENFSQQLKTVKDKNIKIVLCVGKATDDINLCRQIANGFTDLFFIVGSLAGAINEFKDSLGNDTDYFISTTQWEPTLSSPVDYGPDTESFVNLFNAKYGYIPDYTAAQPFNMGIILEYLLSKVDYVDENVLLENALRSELNTFYGNFKIDSFGRQIGHEMLVVQWQYGEKKIVYPEKYCEAEFIIKK